MEWVCPPGGCFPLWNNITRPAAQYQRGLRQTGQFADCLGKRETLSGDDRKVMLALIGGSALDDVRETARNPALRRIGRVRNAGRREGGGFSQ